MNENEKIDKRTMDDEKTVAKVIDYEKDIAPHRCIGLWACVGSGKNYFAESFITGNAKYGIPQLTVLIITSRKSKVVETLSEFGDEEKLNCRLTNAANDFYFRDKYGYVPDECWKTVLAEDGNTYGILQRSVVCTNSGDVCAILIKSKSFNDYYKLMEVYGANASLLCINPATVLREVLEQVDLSTQIVYILCAIILLMNIVVISVITLLNMYDAQKEIALMRLIGISMRKIGQLYLIQNGIIGLISTVLALILSHACLGLMGSFVASMGIVLNVTAIYPLEWAIMALVFVLSVLPTMVRILSMSRKDSLSV